MMVVLEGTQGKSWTWKRLRMCVLYKICDNEGKWALETVV